MKNKEIYEWLETNSFFLSSFREGLKNERKDHLIRVTQNLFKLCYVDAIIQINLFLESCYVSANS